MSNGKPIPDAVIERARELRAAGRTWAEVSSETGFENLCQAIRWRDRNAPKAAPQPRVSRCDHCGHGNAMRSYFCEKCRIITRTGKSAK